MVEQSAPSVWDSHQYWLKAKSYIAKALEHGSDDPDYALWYAFALELLARAVLCNVHPVLNADPNNVQSLFYGVNVVRTERPKSLPIHAVYGRLVLLLDDFTKDHESFCGEMANLRNAELHSAELAFSGLKTQTWLTRFYEVVELLCAAMGHSLEDLLGSEEAAAAHTLIEASKSAGLGNVKARIAGHKENFDQLPEESRVLLLAAAKVAQGWDTKSMANCPACESNGQLRGVWLREGKPVYDGADLVIEVTHLTNGFKCNVCDLELHGEKEIFFAELPPTFTETQYTSLHEVFEPEYENEYMNM